MNTRDFTFREFIVNTDSYSPADIFALYNGDPEMTMRKISLLTGKSLGGVYRALEKYGCPNRQGRNYHLIDAYAEQGLSPRKIAELVGYTERGIRNILKRRHNGNQSE